MNVLSIELFKDLYRTKKPIQLFNIYKGIPINYEGTVSGIKNEILYIKTNAYQLHAMLLEGRTYLEHDTFPLTIKAEVIKTYPEKTIALLQNFIFTKRNIGDRDSVRVEADYPSMVTLTGRRSTTAILYELSNTGMALHLAPGFFKNANLKPEDEVFIDFMIPLNEDGIILKEPIRMSGTIVTIRADKEKNMYRIGIQTYPDPKTEPLILKYISLRQSEILRELRSETQE
ncbi:MAG: PilZ domain-containing protein [Anaerolineaceae bacterium]|nr:PilZ domain-containing protein [Anaerolineaceae bacterium]